MKAGEGGDGNQVCPRRQREGDGVRSNRNQKGLQASSFLSGEDLWFSSLERWSGQVLPFERIAWMKIRGVPLHLAENAVFNTIAAGYGKVVQPSQLQVILKWRDRAFRVWISEEEGIWLPECLDPVSMSGPEKECHEYGEAGVKSGDKAGRDNPIVDLSVDTGINGVAGDWAGVVAGEKSIVHEDSNQTLHREQGGALYAAQRPSSVLFFNSRDDGDINKRVIRERKDQAQRSPDFLLAYAKFRKRPRRDDPFGLNELLGLDTVFSPSRPDLQPQGVGSTEVDNNPVLDLVDLFPHLKIPSFLRRVILSPILSKMSPNGTVGVAILIPTTLKERLRIRLTWEGWLAPIYRILGLWLRKRSWLKALMWWINECSLH
ncbi:hypothetical protein L1987_29950 [Smallanthus sonchifolius]|uniref:Uncharacterized protein n=1 Tax=Smallanthus sonchifolius TaxID=185202 RepID=A0ACB9I0U0_9ASTR|nr:hypothetical protein L1987_29950 [Smallanthus sonchifolius]